MLTLHNQTREVHRPRRRHNPPLLREDRFDTKISTTISDENTASSPCVCVASRSHVRIASWLCNGVQAIPYHTGPIRRRRGLHEADNEWLIARSRRARQRRGLAVQARPRPECGDQGPPNGRAPLSVSGEGPSADGRRGTVRQKRFTKSGNKHVAPVFDIVLHGTLKAVGVLVATTSEEKTCLILVSAAFYFGGLRPDYVARVLPLLIQHDQGLFASG